MIHSFVTLAFYVTIITMTYSVVTVGRADEQDPSKQLLKVVMQDSSLLVGYTLGTDGQTVEFFDLKAGSSVRFQRTEVKGVSEVTFEEAVKTAGFPTLFTWKINGVIKDGKKLGKVAKVTPQIVYVNLGANQGMRTNSELSVFRTKGAVVDPDTGETLAIERPKIAELVVSEVDQLYCKAKIAGELEVSLEIGDEVEADNPVVVAVCPLTYEDGTISNANSALGESLVTAIVNRKITVVDRSNLSDVLGELLLQNTLLFDRNSAKKVGELTGASHVVVGKIIPTSRTRGTAFIRLVEVQTGRIVVASTLPVDVSDTDRKQSSKASVPGGPRGRAGVSRALPSFLTTRSQYQRTPAGGIRIQGGNQYSTRHHGSIQTKDVGFIAKDFVFEVVLEFEQVDGEASIGIGPGLADVSYNGLTDSVYLQIINPSSGSARSGGQVMLNRFKLGRETIGELPNAGPHRIRITKVGSTVTFRVDSGNDGPTDDDFETTIHDIGEAGPFFNSKNSPLFFGGGGEFSNALLEQ